MASLLGQFLRLQSTKEGSSDMRAFLIDARMPPYRDITQQSTIYRATLVGEGRSAGAPSMAMMGEEPICESAFLLEAIGVTKVSLCGV